MGRLFLIATPIGNLGDITLRAIEVLKQVDLVVSEDTRRTAILLRHLGISKPQISFGQHNQMRVLGKIMDRLRSGSSIALVADAGTPAISDPGLVLVRAALEAGIEMTMIPGPTAFVMALVLSGLPTSSFTFKGFPPRRPGPRRRFLQADAESPHTLIFYESPHRLRAFLEDALGVYGDRRAALAKELTKVFESVQRGTLSQLLTSLPDRPRGEFVVVIEGSGTKKGRGGESFEGI
ncbi:MAG: 16S rRNA (cytidine(1402)-2'-O)-methyltransferase [Sedimentisphaerales bacterium]|jgi:16S rRNA (cytidine1402-2'-O)-methyltransferase|nr:16S rRNA (cytidine(1402)-2'-O)-methyltransferase [Sedimentisphaerales bacterium]